MRKLIRRQYGGERGFTMLELLIVIIILGILAGVLVPRLMSMRSAGDVAAANQEVASVESAAQVYLANNDVEPAGTNTPANGCLLDPPGNQTAYISAAAKYYDYTFDGDCKVNIAGNTTSLIGGLTWANSTHKWVK